MSGTRLDWISFGSADSSKAYAAAADLMMQLPCQIEKGTRPCRACNFQPDLSLTLEGSCLIGVEQRSSYSQTRQSLVAAITWDLETVVLCDIGALGTPRPKRTVPAWAAMWLRDYGMTVDMRSKHPRTLSCDGTATATLCACHLIYIGIVVVVCHVNRWCNHTTVLISTMAFYTMLANVPNYRTIREWHVKVEIMTWYMISCGCGLILISSVTH